MTAFIERSDARKYSVRMRTMIAPVIPDATPAPTATMPPPMFSRLFGSLKNAKTSFSAESMSRVLPTVFWTQPTKSLFRNCCEIRG